MIEKRVEKTDVFITDDGREFRNLSNAKEHEKFLDRKGVAKELEEYIHKVFDIPTQEEIDKAFDEDNWDKAEEMEEIRNEHLFDNCVGMYADLEINEISKAFVDMWQSFGEEKVDQFFLLVKERLAQ